MIVSVSVGMVLILALPAAAVTKRKRKPRQTPADRPRGNTHIEEFKQDLENESQKLKDEPIRLNQAKQNFEHAHRERPQAAAQCSRAARPSLARNAGRTSRAVCARPLRTGLPDSLRRQGEEPEGTVGQRKSQAGIRVPFRVERRAQLPEGRDVPPAGTARTDASKPYERAVQAYQAAAAAPLRKHPARRARLHQDR